MSALRWLYGMTVVAALGIGSMAGAACGRTAAAQAPPPPPPPPPPGREMPPITIPGMRYQYTCQTDLTEKIWKPDVVAHLNRMGAEGWRLMPMRNNQNSDQYCFERAY